MLAVYNLLGWSFAFVAVFVIYANLLDIFNSQLIFIQLSFQTN